MRMIPFMIILVLITSSLSATNNGIHSLRINEIIAFYNEPIEGLRKLDPDKNAETLSENRIKINYLKRHIAALASRINEDISEHLKSICKDSIIKLYEELDKLQSEIIMENIKSINDLSIYLAQFKNRKQGQDEVIDDISQRVASLRNILGDLSDTFDSYDRIIEKQNELITKAMDLNTEAYKNTIFLTPGLEAAKNLSTYVSLGLGYLTNDGRFSYGGIIEAGFSPTQDIVNVGVSVLVGFSFGRVTK